MPALELSDTRKNQILMWGLYAAPIALILSIISPIIALSIKSQIPEPQNVHAEVDQQTAAEQFSRDFMTLWLAGVDKGDSPDGSPNAKTMQRMVSVPGEWQLPPQGYRVENIDVRVLSTYDLSGGDETLDEKGMKIRATALVAPPGSSGAARRTFEFDVMAKDGDNFRVTALPRQVGVTQVPYEAVPAYNYVAGADTPLGQSAQRFVEAYFLPKDSNAGLGATVSENFRGVPVSNPMWEKVQVARVDWYAPADSPHSGGVLDDVQTGDVIHAMLTVRGESTTATFSTVQVPARMIVTSNGQWVVDALEDEVFINDTKPLGS